MYSKMNQKAPKILKFFARTMQYTPNCDESLTLNSFNFYRNFEVVQFLDKPETGLLKIFNKPTDVTSEHLAPDGKVFYPQRYHLTPFHPKEPLLFPHIQSYN